MIEKPYGRPTIGDVVGYTGKSSFPSEDPGILVKIEGTTIEIPVDPAKIGSLREQNPPGSRITVWFYNCGWHIEGNPNSSQADMPRIGISISELLASRSEPAAGAEPGIDLKAADMGPAHGQVIAPAEPQEEDAQMAATYINELEIEFKKDAETILKNIDLSHLNVKAHGKAH